MNYKQCIDYLYSLQKFGIKFGLSSTENLLAGLGRPHEHLPCIHLAGTNGKGSVGAMACAMLRAAGYRVGFYTSPHLVSFRERFTINGEMISAQDVIRLMQQVRSVASEEEPATFFEFVTAMAFQYFKEQAVDLLVLETGLGGRLDATNVAQPMLGVITNISLEHTIYLGNTIKEIAFEKAGIIKPGMTVITGEKPGDALDLFEQVSAERGARLLVSGRDFQVTPKADGFDYHGITLTLEGLKTRLLGPHQVQNAALSLAAVEMLGDKGFRVAEDHYRTGLATVTWPGRAELTTDPNGGPALMLDGAHNPGAAAILAEALKTLNYPKVHMVLGIMADKEIDRIMSLLVPCADTLYLSRPQYSRAASPETLADIARDYQKPMHIHQTIPSAIEAVRAAAAPEDLILITGSLYVVGEAKAYLTGEEDDGPI